ncbi:MAG: SDR family NAD(P)-dependent oxidoreductase [Vallitalea sp.]|nr:SDR family NAD(P)-dependent oxidoreductase [Vallitalea sp.]
MSQINILRNEILQLVKKRIISPEEGKRRLKELNSNISNIQDTEKITSVKQEGIAIIGISGRFPGADYLWEYWDNLKEGKDHVKEIHNERWIMDNYYCEDIKKAGKTYSKFSGLLSNIYNFDPSFFNITPRESELMDPQQRIVLQESWKAIVNGGYTTQELDGANCGVFIGVRQGDYANIVKQEKPNINPQYLTGGSAAMIPSRIAYYLNLMGPSIAIDTACSSSMIAILQACDSISNGNCEMALAGGACVYATPEMHISTSKGGMLSRTGKCRSFDDDADGFVLSEGAGIVLLKSLDKAIEDKDYIYGVIKGWGANQDGKTNGITAPSSSAQYDLETNVYNKYNINPASISYVEAHGTGTKLGDPIELEALTKAFSTYTKEKQYCAIGSVKSNIGHTLAASGVASLIKVILCMQNKELVPSIHVNKENSHIDFANSPFYVINEHTNWNPIEGYKRRAAISSFGLSGTNGHLVIEEYNNKKVNVNENSFYICPISAKSKKALDESIKSFALWLQHNKSNVDIEDIAYTMGICRDHFKYRCCLIVKDIVELEYKLDELMKGQPSLLRDTSKTPNMLIELAQYYVAGNDADFTNLYTSGQKIPIESVGFDEKVYKVTSKMTENRIENISTLSDTIFKFTLYKNDYYIKDHIINGVPIVPGVVQLDLAKIAGNLGIGNNVTEIKDVKWISPIILEESSIDIEVALNKTDTGIAFTLRSKLNEDYQIHSKGIMNCSEEVKDTRVKIEDIKNRLIEKKQSFEIYNLYNRMGISYGDSMKTIDIIDYNEYEALAKLTLKASEEDVVIDHTINPAIMDGVIQSVIGFREIYELEDRRTYVPSSIGTIEIYNKLPNKGYVHITKKQNNLERKVFNINLLDHNGKVIVHIEDYTISPFNKGQISNNKQYDTLYFEPSWKQQELPINNSQQDKCLIIIQDKPSYTMDIHKYNMKAVYHIIFGYGYGKIADNMYMINPERQEDYQEVFEELRKKDISMENILFANQQVEQIENITTNNSQLPVQLLVLIKALTNIKGNTNMRLLYNYIVGEDITRPEYGAIAGLFRTVHIENPNIHCKLIATNQSIEDNEQKQILLNELFSNVDDAVDIHYDKNSTRWIRVFKEYLAHKENTLLVNKGVYIITGGTGGLGIIMANYLLSHYNAHVILVGRSSYESIEHKIQPLKHIGGYIDYYSCNISVDDEVQRLKQYVLSKYNKVDGIIHSAGVINDQFIINKTIDDFQKVIQPKKYGVLNLDSVFADVNLTFFAMFSAMASVIGNVGQSDYAYANNFIDLFSIKRNTLVKEGKRKGKTISINWPLWDSKGMTVDSNTETMLYKKYGMKKLTGEIGVEAFEKVLSSNRDQLAVIYGNVRNIRNYFTEYNRADQLPIASTNYIQENVHIVEETNVITKASEQDLRDYIIEYLKDIFSDVIKLDKDLIGENKTFEELGIDSLIIVNINWALEETFGNISKTLLFEYKTIGELSTYFMNNYKHILQNNFENTQPIKEKKQIRVEKKGCNNKIVQPSIDKKIHNIEEVIRSNNEDIAIIGLSGKYPMAEDVDTFFDNLSSGKDCIEEIPSNRWKIEEFYNEDKEALGSSYSKWGGFIDGVDLFDPLFFNIAPKEAELMDPQERLFLIESYKAIQDAGYNRESLTDYKVGVYASAMYSHYQLLGLDKQYKGSTQAINTSFSSIANRVSYYYDFRGPSMTIDTMCSSALTSIHLACDSIRNGSCEMALAGAVNLSLHPNKYLVLSQGKFMSTHGKCKSFGEGGDGYVPGEGVGVVILKSHRKAIQDKDQIYGVIKGSGLNHGGRTNGYSVPNPNEQGQLIKEVLEKNQIPKESITYIETHGTGTSLGDPIEISGLEKAFGTSNNGTKTCALGSVKSNIGHLEAAAGMASVTKVLMQMKHKKLVPSLHSTTLNPNINLDNLPFYVQQKYSDWNKLVNEHSKEEKFYPRRAGISAFGAGGSNGHLIIEEAPNRTKLPKPNQQLIILSGKTEDKLKAYAKTLFDYFNKDIESATDLTYNMEHIENNLIAYFQERFQHDVHKVTTLDNINDFGMDTVDLSIIGEKINSQYYIPMDVETIIQHKTIEDMAKYISIQCNKTSKCKMSEKLLLEDVAYTLQRGREAYPYRMALIVSNMNELVEKLSKYTSSEDTSAIYLGKQDNILEDINVDDLPHYIDNKDLHALGTLWTSGKNIDFKLLYQDEEATCISLPSYPLSLKRYWINSFEEKNSIITKSEIKVAQKNSNIKKLRTESNIMENKGALHYTGDEVSLKIIENNIAIVTLQDKEGKNTFSEQVINGLIAKFQEIQNNKEIKAVIVTGDEHIFCMGGTKQQLINISNRQSKFSDAPFLYKGLLQTNVPVIAAMQGHASGGGMLFGLYADIVIMAEEAVYSAVFTKYGFTPGMGGTYILKEKFGENIATEMMFTAKTYTGEELQKRGASVIMRKQNDVLKEALSIARLLADKPRKTLKALKKELASRKLAVLDEYIDIEEAMHLETFSQDMVQDRIKHYYRAKEEQPSNVQEIAASQEIKTHKLKSTQQVATQKIPSNIESVKHNNISPIQLDKIKKRLGEIVCKTLHLDEGDINFELSFREIGVDSISSVEIVRDVNKDFDIHLDAVIIYDYPTIYDFAVYIKESMEQKELPHSEQSSKIGQSNAVKWGMKKNKEKARKPIEKHKANNLKISQKDIINKIKLITQNTLHIEKEDITDNMSFKDMGVDSITSVELIRDINKAYSLQMDAIMTYDYPNINLLSSYVYEQLQYAESIVEDNKIDDIPQTPIEDIQESHINKTQDPNTQTNRKLSLKSPKKSYRGIIEESYITDYSSLHKEESSKSVKEIIKDNKDNKHNKTIEETSSRLSDIAIVGIAGKFPGANNVNEFWENLKNGVDSVTKIPSNRWDYKAYFDSNPRTPNKSYSTVGGFLDDYDQFDPLFFNISPLEAEAMDPQQRLFLQVAWQGLEDAGYTIESLSGSKCGVFVGAAQSDYSEYLKNTEAENSAEAFTGLSPAVLSARMSYILNLKGPCISIDTACSSSLVAMHQGCRSLQYGESNLAIAGGVRLMFTPEMHIQTSKMEMLSKSGVVKTFDNDADGTNLSEGVAVVILKRLDEAMKDNDYIYGVIKGSGVNQDGKTNGITAPSAKSQTSLEIEVYEKAGINPQDISYVEAHGTGTKLGDPIEVKALKNAFSKYTDKKQFCAIGSVKTNIGHATMAAGVISVIKVLLSMKNKQIPPSLHFDKENEHIGFKDTPFFVNNKLRSWEVEEGNKRLAAVSAFGFSGTNCHLVIEEPPNWL